jgi:2,3-bisphosphoglycerate-dependent phosphoglycerate mutase
MVKISLALNFILLIFSSCSQSYYIVRHAEKATAETNMNSDVSLTDAGQRRAEALKEILKKKKIGYVYSTNTIRTKSTVQPTADYFKLTIEIYGPMPDTTFITKIKALKKNTVIVGHSNTVDDIVNKLCGEVKINGDLKETEYNDLFIVKKKGKRYVFYSQKYGK